MYRAFLLISNRRVIADELKEVAYKKLLNIASLFIYTAKQSNLNLPSQVVLKILKWRNYVPSMEVDEPVKISSGKFIFILQLSKKVSPKELRS